LHDDQIVENRTPSSAHATARLLPSTGQRHYHAPLPFWPTHTLQSDSLFSSVLNTTASWRRYHPLPPLKERSSELSRPKYPDRNHNLSKFHRRYLSDQGAALRKHHPLLQLDDNSALNLL